MVGLSPVCGSIYFGSLLGLISFIAIAPFPFSLVPLGLQRISSRCRRLVFQRFVKQKNTEFHYNSTPHNLKMECPLHRVSL